MVKGVDAALASEHDCVEGTNKKLLSGIFGKSVKVKVPATHAEGVGLATFIVAVMVAANPAGVPEQMV